MQKDRSAGVLLGNDTYGQELAPRLAHRLGGSAAGDAVDITASAGQLRVTRGVYGGKATAVIALNDRRAWFGCAPVPLRPPRPGAGRGRTPAARASPKISRQAGVASHRGQGGSAARRRPAHRFRRAGLGGPEPFNQLQALADAMGGADGRLAAACDAGWVPASWQVGQTGKKVAPRALHGGRHLRRQPAHHGYCRLEGDLRDQSRPRRADLQALPFRPGRRLSEGRRSADRQARPALMNDPHLATREVLWNISHVWVMYALLLPTVAIAAYGIYRRVRIWRRGKAESRFDQPLARMALVAKNALLQLRTWRQALSGLMHAMIFWGFIVLCDRHHGRDARLRFRHPDHAWLLLPGVSIVHHGRIRGAGDHRPGHGGGAALDRAAERAGLLRAKPRLFSSRYSSSW